MATPKKVARRSRAQLLDALRAAGRQQSTATVLFHGAMAERFGLSATDNKSLELLSRLGPLTAGQLAEHTGLASASVTALIDRLEAKGFVRRVRDPADRRRVVVEIVPEGIAEIAEAFDRAGLSADELWAGYSVEQLSVIHEYLVRSAELLRAATARLTTSLIDERQRTVARRTGVVTSSRDVRPHELASSGDA